MESFCNLHTISITDCYDVAKGVVQLKNKQMKGIFIAAAVVLVLTAGFFTLKDVFGTKQTANPSGQPTQAGATVDSATGNMVIDKSKITSTAAFFPYQSGDTKMEVLAVKATDGTVRTAFNTCQVCYSSGRGYYKLDGETLVCQNCGNRFSPDQVEKQKGGCNPVGITSEYKTEDEKQITMTKDFFEEAKGIFANWKN